MTLVDTSSWIEALRVSGDLAVRVRVRSLLESGEAAWCDLVRLELWNGAGGQAERKVLRKFESDVPNLATTEAVWDLARDLARRSRSAGVTVPSTDVLILACARHHGVALEHCDDHFTALEQVVGA